MFLENITIADFQLITATMGLEVICFDISKYQFVSEWYANYKRENPELWQIVEKGMKEFPGYIENPSELNHSIHRSKI